MDDARVNISVVLDQLDKRFDTLETQVGRLADVVAKSLDVRERLSAMEQSVSNNSRRLDSLEALKPSVYRAGGILAGILFLIELYKDKIFTLFR